MKRFRTMVSGALALLGLAWPAVAAEVDYHRDIQPIFARHCTKCHGPERPKSELRLDSIAGALKGGNSGPALVPGKSSQSLLIDAVTGGENSSEMPPEGKDKLSTDEIALLKRWVDAGAPGPREDIASPAPAVRSDHWSFQPIRSPRPPAVRQSGWVRSPLDAFVLAKLEQAKLKPSPEADRPTLIRRLSLDLLGLPPSPGEVENFVSDSSEGAYDRLVDRLLASPHYGERWGRHWLDQARYADSNGYTIDGARTIWKYRDWVVSALNRDQPFSQFAIEQLAGDLLPKPTTDQLVATGFHRNTLRNEEGGTDPEQFRVEAVVDRVSTTGAVFLGLTVGCARCHDHKYDPISQREFYQLFAVFNNADEPTLSLPTTSQAKEIPAIDAEIRQVEKRIADVDANLAGRQADWEARLKAQIERLSKENGEQSVELLDVIAPLRTVLFVPPAKRSKAQKTQILEEYRKHDVERKPLTIVLTELQQRKKQLSAAITTTLVMKERKEPRETFVHLRGDFLNPVARVSPGAPAVLPPLKAAGDEPNRLDFARWLVDSQNPLTARVTVNRIWQEYFGQGLVPTENDFGTQGDRPSHPELLDWLARRFIDDGWRLKSLHRLIVTSAAYRQSSAPRKELTAQDPYNRLLGRQARMRLEAEVIRDSALAAAGLLDGELGGPGVYPPQPEGIYKFTQQVKYWNESQGGDRYRRTLYTYFWRSSPYPLLTTFDAPDATTSCTRRVRSNTPLQALALANDRGLFEAAQALALRLLADAGDDAARVERAVRLCVARKPNELEAKRLAAFVSLQRKKFAAAPQEAAAAVPAKLPSGVDAVEAASWTALARVVLNLDEFVTRE